MALDRRKEFLKKNPGLVPEDEQVLAVLIVEPKGGAWRRGIGAAGALGDAATSVGKDQPASGEGDVGAWPNAKLLWMALTDTQLHVFEGSVGSGKAGPAAAHYPHDRIAGMTLDKKLLISKLHVNFKDGGSVVLDVSKQKTQPFAEAIQARFAPA